MNQQAAVLANSDSRAFAKRVYDILADKFQELSYAAPTRLFFFDRENDPTCGGRFQEQAKLNGRYIVVADLEVAALLSVEVQTYAEAIKATIRATSDSALREKLTETMNFEGSFTPTVLTTRVLDLLKQEAIIV